MYIGVDIGTSSIKALLVNERGVVVKEVSRAYPLDMPNVNWAEQDPKDWWRQTLAVLKEIVETADGKVIQSISLSGQMHGVVILDEDDTVIRPAMLWCDQRAQEECTYLNDTIGKDTLLSWVGNQALTGFSAPKLLWLKKHESHNFKRIKKIMLPKDYILYQLTGVFATDVSDASGTLLFDVEKKIWSTPMLACIGIAEAQLPIVFESDQIIGVMKKKRCDQLGLHKAPKVVAGAGDQAAAAIGVGAIKQGSLSLSLGTSGVVFSPCEQYIADNQARLHSFAGANNKFYQMGVILSAGAALKWWVEHVHNTCAYEEIIEQDTLHKTAQNLYFLPYMIGERTPIHDPYASGCFIGLNIAHDKGDMTLAVLEGITFALRESFEIIKERKQPFQELRVSGGGSKSKVWKQLIADIFQLPVCTINTVQGPAYGAAILAYVGDTNYDVYDVCNTWVSVSEYVYPDALKAPYYNNKFKHYQTLYPALKHIFQQIHS